MFGFGSGSSGPRGSDATARLSRLPVRQERQSRTSQSLCRASGIPQKKSLEKNLVRSKSSLGEPPRLSRQRSSSVLKQTTPMTKNIRTFKKSPLIQSARKDDRPVTDKRWQFEQLVKVKNFVGTYIPDIDYNSIKPGMSLDTFISLSGMLFQMIDKRLTITKENYLEEIPRTLKMFQYPTTIKPSLMKSVNAPHSWSAVVAILSWLTDLICKTNYENETKGLAEVIDMFMLQMFTKAKPEEEALQELDIKLVEYFKIDLGALEKEENEKKRLQDMMENYGEKVKKDSEEIEILHNLIAKNEAKITEDTDGHNDLVQQMHLKKATTVAAIKKIDVELQNQHLLQEELKNTIANQPHSLAEKQLLVNEIESLQNTLRLKKERSQQQNDIIHSLDHKLSDLGQKLQNLAHNYNNIVSKLELSKPYLKELHIRESGFMKSDTGDEFQKVAASLIDVIEKVKEDKQIGHNKLVQLTDSCKTLSENLVTVKKELEEVTKNEAELELSIKCKNIRADQEKQNLLDHVHTLRSELMELQKQRPNLNDLKDQIRIAEQGYAGAIKEKQEMKTKALEFFIELDSQITGSIKEYLKIMDAITEKTMATHSKLVDDVKSRVELLKQAQIDVELIKNRKDETSQ